MPDGRRLEAIVRELDRSLNRLEAAAIARLDSALRASAVRLEDDLRRLYGPARAASTAESIAFREARARQLLAQVQAGLRLTDATNAATVFNEVASGAYAAGAANAGVALQAYGTTAVLPTVAPLSVAARATNASARLAAHGADFAVKAERIVIDGIVRGRGFRPTAAELRRETGILRHEAERIVRTETVAAADEARRETYAEAGVEYMQHFATADSVVCGYCANRAGRVYKIGEAQVPLHPGCRCALMPWRKEWQDDGLTDDDWAAEHRRKTLERTQDKNRTGAAPSERWRGRETAPEPVWSP
jgi:SPP1 gp7 family putative phage head morphogenesis protein